MGTLGICTYLETLLDSDVSFHLFLEVLSVGLFLFWRLIVLVLPVNQIFLTRLHPYLISLFFLLITIAYPRFFLLIYLLLFLQVRYFNLFLSVISSFLLFRFMSSLLVNYLLTPHFNLLLCFLQSLSFLHLLDLSISDFLRLVSYLIKIVLRCKLHASPICILKLTFLR